MQKHKASTTYTSAEAGKSKNRKFDFSKKAHSLNICKCLHTSACTLPCTVHTSTKQNQLHDKDRGQKQKSGKA